MVREKTHNFFNSTSTNEESNKIFDLNKVKFVPVEVDFERTDQTFMTVEEQLTQGNYKLKRMNKTLKAIIKAINKDSIVFTPRNLHYNVELDFNQTFSPRGYHPEIAFRQSIISEDTLP